MDKKNGETPPARPRPGHGRKGGAAKHKSLFDSFSEDKRRVGHKTPESKSLLVLFFRKEQILLFLKKKKQKDFYSSAPLQALDLIYETFSKRSDF